MMTMVALMAAIILVTIIVFMVSTQLIGIIKFDYSFLSLKSNVLLTVFLFSLPAFEFEFSLFLKIIMISIGILALILHIRNNIISTNVIVGILGFVTQLIAYPLLLGPRIYLLLRNPCEEARQEKLNDEFYASTAYKRRSNSEE